MADVDVDAVIPQEWMHADAVHQVVGLLRNLRVLPSKRRELYARWCLIVGIPIDPELAAYVQVVNRK